MKERSLGVCVFVLVLTHIFLVAMVCLVTGSTVTEAVISAWKQVALVMLLTDICGGAILTLAQQIKRSSWLSYFIHELLESITMFGGMAVIFLTIVNFQFYVKHLDVVIGVTAAVTIGDALRANSKYRANKQNNLLGRGS